MQKPEPKTTKSLQNHHLLSDNQPNQQQSNQPVIRSSNLPKMTKHFSQTTTSLLDQDPHRQLKKCQSQRSSLFITSLQRKHYKMNEQCVIKHGDTQISRQSRPLSTTRTSFLLSSVKNQDVRISAHSGQVSRAPSVRI